MRTLIFLLVLTALPVSLTWGQVDTSYTISYACPDSFCVERTIIYKSLGIKTELDTISFVYDENMERKKIDPPYIYRIPIYVPMIDDPTRWVLAEDTIIDSTRTERFCYPHTITFRLRSIKRDTTFKQPSKGEGFYLEGNAMPNLQSGPGMPMLPTQYKMVTCPFCGETIARSSPTKRELCGYCGKSFDVED